MQESNRTISLEIFIWRTPYMDFDDTSNVPIPISNPTFENKENIVSFDFPIWFNLESSKRIMMITQDPMPRDRKWYRACRDVICSTTFGIHNASWRNKGNGGMRMWLLVQQLIGTNIGVYLTDCKKFYIQSVDGEHIKETSNQIAAYSQLLQAEIDIIQPSLIVSFGNEAKNQLSVLLKETSIPILGLPHFSGQAQGAIRNFFNYQEEESFTVKNQVKNYVELIINSIK